MSDLVLGISVVSCAIYGACHLIYKAYNLIRGLTGIEIKKQRDVMYHTLLIRIRRKSYRRYSDANKELAPVRKNEVRVGNRR